MPHRNPLTIGNRPSEPRYRFWGNQRPNTEHRERIRAAVTSSGDGVGSAAIRLYGPIDSWGDFWGVSAAEFAQALDELDSSVNDIQLHLNSPGGEVYEGIAILNQLRQHPANVTAVVDSLAASAASFIAAGVDELVMAPNSQLMIHDAWGICVGPAADMAEMGALLDKISANIADVYATKATAATVDQWRAAMLAESWYDAREAVDAGLADRVDGDVPDDAAATAGFDLSVFKHQGRAAAPAPLHPGESSAELLERATAAVDDLTKVGEAANHATAELAQRMKNLAPSAKQLRRHRMNARRHALPL